ncbi:MAG: B12-binding domain-containing radical SAM protein [Acidobacteria bacterium]|nr:B12-binding domain-containing radical SAM protein [Acidobacteriota bacterium]
MKVHLINPSGLSFGVGVITPRWLFVLAAATPASYGDPIITDETLDPWDPSTVSAGDVVGIGIHTGNAQEGYAIGRKVRERGGYVIFGGIHATLYPEEALKLGGAHSVVKGDGDVVWATVLADCTRQAPQPMYDGGKVEGGEFKPARWSLMPKNKYMWASVQTVRGCPKHCSFCSVWKTDGQRPRQRTVDAVLDEIVELRRMGFRFIALADDNFYPVTLDDLAKASRRQDKSRYEELKAMRAERFELMSRLAGLPDDMVFFTQITMEAAEDPQFLDAMRNARIKGALVGVEAVTAEGLKDVYKDFNLSGEQLVDRLRAFRHHGVHILASFIFGLPSDRPDTFAATAQLAERSGVTFAQFLMLTPFPGTVDFAAWEKNMASDPTRIDGIPLTRHWLIPHGKQPKVYVPHPLMSPDDIRAGTQGAWDRFYNWRNIWARSNCVESIKSRLAFMLISKLYRQMYANTGIATDSARVNRSATWARMIAKPCQRLFAATPMPELQVPGT